MIDRLGLGPVVVIGQSLGGAAALLLAEKYPESIAGLVLLDPTPVSDATLATAVEKRSRSVVRFAQNPQVERLLRRLLAFFFRRSARRHKMSPAARAVGERFADVDLAKLHRAATGIDVLAAAFDARRLPQVPAIVVTADRRAKDRIRLAHARLADALAAPLVTWPGAEHHVHLTHPDQVLAACRGVLRQLGPH